MDWVTSLGNFTLTAWELLASVVTILVGIPIIIATLRKPPKKTVSKDTVTETPRIEVIQSQTPTANTNTFNLNLHLHDGAGIGHQPELPSATTGGSSIAASPPSVSATPLTPSAAPTPPDSEIVNAATEATHPIPPKPQAPTNQPVEPSAPTFNQSTGTHTTPVSPHVEPVRPPADNTDDNSTLMSPERSPQSGKLAAAHIERRAKLRGALRAASYLFQEIRSYSDKYANPSQSDQPYRNNVRLHKVLLDYLRATREPVVHLNRDLNKLEDMTWEGGDPREVFFAESDPLSLGTPAETRAAFHDALENMVNTVKAMGYTVIRRDEIPNLEFPNRKWVWHLTKARNLKLEPFDVQDDESEDDADDGMIDEE